jgi:hypothetical protein
MQKETESSIDTIGTSCLEGMLVHNIIFILKSSLNK